ncbi:AI-2E family transporter [Desertivirga xinjiangensis]|uniref:AI-2E family transporter n=1 Tax=Desertivirga xinjiangensis TaxID=539206 RepID=UPI00210DCC0E|nr:AI-2E family transporter [Pedobacter xinjiangensis]
MHNPSLNRSANFLIFLFLVFAGLYFARPFLIPFTLAAIISMLLLPLSKRIESRGLSRPFAAGISLLMLLLVVSGIIALLVWQISGIAKDFSEMQQKLSELLHQIQRLLHNKLGITEAEQKKFLESSQPKGGGGMTKLLSNTLGMMVNLVLVLVYTFIFIYFRSHLKKFILKLVPAENLSRAEKVLHDTTQVSYKYLSGMATMIVMLWILYGIGFSAVGIKNALFFAVLCGTLEIVPFVGNLTGTSITVLMAVTQGGGGGMIIGVVAIYLLVQFIQSYIIEPMVVGAEVNINPLFTIIALVVGELLWGIAGLVLAIPLLGMLKIICDNIEPLKPYGYLIGEDKPKRESPWIDKVKAFFKF